MARIVIASAAEESREKLSQLLASSGFSVFRCCASGSELRRTINECEDGIVVLIGVLPDCKPDELYWDYWDRIQILLIARPHGAGTLRNAGDFPAAAAAVLPGADRAVQMLSQLHRMRLPRRAGTEKETVNQAKRLLMKQHGITEPEAHRALQQYAMNHGVRMADYAAQILRASRETDQ